MNRHARRFAGTINASGVVLEPIPGFGLRDGEVVDLEPGTRLRRASPRPSGRWRSRGDQGLAPPPVFRTGRPR